MKKLILLAICAASTCFAADRYMCEFEISQTSLTLDIWQHVRDAANAFSIAIPVDKQFYNSVRKGQKLTSKDKTASFLLGGSFKTVNIYIKNKWISHE